MICQTYSYIRNASSCTQQLMRNIAAVRFLANPPFLYCVLENICIMHRAKRMDVLNIKVEELVLRRMRNAADKITFGSRAGDFGMLQTITVSHQG